MSAETLRRAAALMRERAETATPAPWCADGSDVLEAANAAQVADCFDLPSANGSHIASWHPAVALAVADLLDNEASLIEGTAAHPDLHMPLNGARVDLLAAVANAYLGEPA